MAAQIFDYTRGWTLGFQMVLRSIPLIALNDAYACQWEGRITHIGQSRALVSRWDRERSSDRKGVDGISASWNSPDRVHVQIMSALVPGAQADLVVRALATSPPFHVLASDLPIGTHKIIKRNKGILTSVPSENQSPSARVIECCAAILSRDLRSYEFFVNRASSSNCPPTTAIACHARYVPWCFVLRSRTQFIALRRAAKSLYI